jgi:hypothetical protein
MIPVEENGIRRGGGDACYVTSYGKLRCAMIGAWRLSNTKPKAQHRAGLSRGAGPQGGWGANGRAPRTGSTSDWQTVRSGPLPARWPLRLRLEVSELQHLRDIRIASHFSAYGMPDRPSVLSLRVPRAVRRVHERRTRTEVRFGILGTGSCFGLQQVVCQGATNGGDSWKTSSASRTAPCPQNTRRCSARCWRGSARHSTECRPGCWPALYSLGSQL